MQIARMSPPIFNLHQVYFVLSVAITSVYSLDLLVVHKDTIVARVYSRESRYVETNERDSVGQYLRYLGRQIIHSSELLHELHAAVLHTSKF